jgi:hypothetical protein
MHVLCILTQVRSSGRHISMDLRNSACELLPQYGHQAYCQQHCCRLSSEVEGLRKRLVRRRVLLGEARKAADAAAKQYDALAGMKWTPSTSTLSCSCDHLHHQPCHTSSPCRPGAGP